MPLEENPRLVKGERAARFRLVEEMLAAGRLEREITRALREEHGLRHRQARRYLTVARTRLAREASVDPVSRQKWRGQLTAMCLKTFEAALSRKRPVVVPGKGGARVELHDDPDAGAADRCTRTLSTLLALDGGTAAREHDKLIPTSDAAATSLEARQQAAADILRKHYFGDAEPPYPRSAPVDAMPVRPRGPLVLTATTSAPDGASDSNNQGTP